jgi:hypothetical protein
MAARLTCRLHLWHRWRTYRSQETGWQYQECLDCHRQRDVSKALPGA